MTEDRLLAVTVGKRDPLNEPIELVPYDLAWPARYAVLEAQIREALGPKALMVEHVGSTSVPGLAAKPIIDVVLAVLDSADESSYVPLLESLGYVLRIREPDWFDHRMLKSPEIDGNIHVFSHSCEEISRMLTFRDWLRTNGRDRRLYEQKKHELAARTWKHTQNYADAKSDVVRDILDRAFGAGRRPA